MEFVEVSHHVTFLCVPANAKLSPVWVVPWRNERIRCYLSTHQARRTLDDISETYTSFAVGVAFRVLVLPESSRKEGEIDGGVWVTCLRSGPRWDDYSHNLTELPDCEGFLGVVAKEFGFRSVALLGFEGNRGDNFSNARIFARWCGEGDIGSDPWLSRVAWERGPNLPPDADPC